MTVYKKPRTCRIDRMKEVSLTWEPRTGEEHFKDVDIRTYAQRVFGMYGGAKQKMTIDIRISCMKTLKNLPKINPCCDTIVTNSIPQTQ